MLTLKWIASLILHVVYLLFNGQYEDDHINYSLLLSL